MAFGFFKKKKAGSATDHYFNLTIKEVVKETADAVSIVFEQPENKLEYRSGQFLTLIENIEGKEARRSYSLSSSPYTDDDLAVTIKRVPGGLLSNYLNDNAKAGSTMRVMEAMGNFTTEYKASNKRHIIMFAGGSGITPIMSIAKSTMVKEPESIVSLIYCNRDIDSIIFKEQLAQMEREDEGRMHVIHVLDNAPLEWQGASGLLNHEMLTKLLERIPDWGNEKTTYLMCGPEGMMQNIDTLLAQQSIPANRIFKESFVVGTINKKESESSDKLQTRDVTIVYDGEEHQITVKPKSFILETALDAGIDLPFSCQSGLCTACRGKCVSGEVRMDEEEGLSEAEKEQGYVLICVGHPLTDDVRIEIG